jgi:hypothetical protein
MKRIRVATLLILALALPVMFAGCGESKPGEAAHDAVEVGSSCQSLSPAEKEKCEAEYRAKGEGSEETKDREAAKKEAEKEDEEIREGERIKREKPQEAKEIEEALGK